MPCQVHCHCVHMDTVDPWIPNWFYSIYYIFNHKTGSIIIIIIIIIINIIMINIIINNTNIQLIYYYYK